MPDKILRARFVPLKEEKRDIGERERERRIDSKHECPNRPSSKATHWHLRRDTARLYLVLLNIDERINRHKLRDGSIDNDNSKFFSIVISLVTCSSSLSRIFLEPYHEIH